MHTLPSRLCVICDAEVCRSAGWTLPSFARTCLDAGARFLQVRAKCLGSGAFLEVSAEIVESARATDALVVVNDRADIAKLAGAGGVHLGQEDVPPAGVRAVVGGGTVVGLSTHTTAQLDDALRQPVDYIAVGPVYGTPTKDTGHAPVGLGHVVAAVQGAARRAPSMLVTPITPSMPIVAIGGITLERAAATIEAGAAAVAVISDLLSTGDPAARVAAFLRALR